MDQILSRLWVLLCVLLLAPSTAFGAAAFGSAASSSVVAGTSLTYSLSIPSGSDVAIAVAVQFESGTVPASLSVAVGGVALSAVSGTTGAGLGNAIYTAGYTGGGGTQPVVLKWSGAENVISGAIAATGVSQSTPMNGGGNATGATSPGSLAVTSTSGDLTTTLMFALNAATTLTSDQTERWGPTTGSALFAKGDTGPGTGTTTHNWTEGVDATWGMSGANFVQSTLSTGYVLTEGGDCINAENGDRLITETGSPVGPCAAAATATPERSKMGVGI